MRTLLPRGADAGTTDLDALADLYLSGLPTDRSARWVRANFVSTLDGAATGADGRSGSINSEADHVVFELLRALSDCVVVGAGTVRAEGYSRLTLPDDLLELRQRRGGQPQLPLVVVTNRGTVPDTLAGPADDGGPVLVAAPESAITEALRRTWGPQLVSCGQDTVDVHVLLDLLARRGLTRVLTEGGPSLFGSLMAAGVVDELCLTITPMTAGGAEHPRISGMPSPPRQFTLSTLVEQDGSLMGRWVSRR